MMEQKMTHHWRLRSCSIRQSVIQSQRAPPSSSVTGSGSSNPLKVTSSGQGSRCKSIPIRVKAKYSKSLKVTSSGKRSRCKGTPIWGQGQVANERSPHRAEDRTASTPIQVTGSRVKDLTQGHGWPPPWPSRHQWPWHEHPESNFQWCMLQGVAVQTMHLDAQMILIATEQSRKQRKFFLWVFFPWMSYIRFSARSFLTGHNTATEKKFITLNLNLQI